MNKTYNINLSEEQMKMVRNALYHHSVAREKWAREMGRAGDKITEQLALDQAEELDDLWVELGKLTK